MRGGACRGDGEMGLEAFSFFADGDKLQAWIEAQGPLAQASMVSLVVAQAVVTVLPGEPLELAAGYAFGFWEGRPCAFWATRWARWPS